MSPLSLTSMIWSYTQTLNRKGRKSVMELWHAGVLPVSWLRNRSSLTRWSHPISRLSKYFWRLKPSKYGYSTIFKPYCTPLNWFFGLRHRMCWAKADSFAPLRSTGSSLQRSRRLAALNSGAVAGLAGAVGLPRLRPRKVSRGWVW